MSREQMQADLDNVFFVEGGFFSEPLPFTPPAGEPVEAYGIFDEGYTAVDPDTGVKVMGYGPMCSVASRHFSAMPEEGWTVLRVETGKRYAVVEPMPSADGLVIEMRLKEID